MRKKVGNRYEVIEEIGQGGNAFIYKAFDTYLKRYMALKILKAKSATTELRTHFLHEQQIMAGLQHSNIVQVFDCSDPQKQVPYYVMQYIEGQSLQTLATTQKLPESVLVALISEIAAALAHAHSKNIGHGDLKPANVLINNDGRVVLIDFNNAQPNNTNSIEVNTSAHDSSLIGTLDYLAPEQIRNKETNLSSDIFALGCVAYCAATGVSPFAHDDEVEIMRKILDGEYRPLSELRYDLSAVFTTLVTGCLQLECEKRFNALQVMHICEQWLCAHGTTAFRVLNKFLS
ncbi:MAG: serine/threonine protein kinase [Deltaproteobacteria bacterium]|nr:serine/threonine protein kinase [Deltaproteobacteria bacterium]